MPPRARIAWVALDANFEGQEYPGAAPLDRAADRLLICMGSVGFRGIHRRLTRQSSAAPISASDAQFSGAARFTSNRTGL